MCNQEEKTNTRSCRRSFTSPGVRVINHYKCNQQGLSSAGLWKINKQKKGVGLRLNFINN